MNEEKVNVEKKSLKLKDGLIVFVISMLFFVFLGSYVQSIAIIPGLLFTEFGIALIPIVYLKCKKLSIKE
ncbi:MAG: hypothetical protein LBR30_00660, partial [Clostridioides sp.]|nr:hypothetical protein [Clostridioides sp.]